MDGTTQLLEIDRRYLVHPLHHPDDHRQPLVVVEGKGAILRDAEGRDYIDGLSGLWNVNVGHGRGELADAASTQMRRIASPKRSSATLTRIPPLCISRPLAPNPTNLLSNSHGITGRSKTNQRRP